MNRRGLPAGSGWLYQKELTVRSPSRLCSGWKGETPILKARFQGLSERDDFLIFSDFPMENRRQCSFSTLSRETMMTSYSLSLCHSRHFQTHLISLPNRWRGWIGLHLSVFFNTFLFLKWGCPQSSKSLDIIWLVTVWALVKSCSV